jgi:hypothetical protein
LILFRLSKIFKLIHFQKILSTSHSIAIDYIRGNNFKLLPDIIFMKTNFILCYSLLIILFIDWMFGGFILRLPFEITSIFFGFVTWILPGIFLWKFENGKKIYLINLLSGIIFLVLVYFVSLKSQSSGSIAVGLNNIELLVFAIFCMADLGLGALILFRNKKIHKCEKIKINLVIDTK